MRVAINLIGLPSTHQGGAGFYAGTLVRALLERGGHDLIVLAGPRVVQELSELAGNIELHEADDVRTSRAARAAQLAGAIRNPRRFDPHPELRGSLAHCDVVHYPLGFISGPAHQARVVVTAVDLQHLAFPQFFSRKDRLLRRIRWHRAWATADRLVVFSEFVRRELVERLGASPRRIDVVHAACHDAFFSSASAMSQGENPPDPFFFFPASPLPAKNHERLFHAFGGLADCHPQVRLRLSGPLGHDWSTVRAAAEAIGVVDKVDFLGHLTLDELKTTYAHATALVFPSLYEGFGIPVLEGMASGCLVVASDAASLPELIAGAGLLFDATSPERIRAAMSTALRMSSGQRVELTSRAQAKARTLDGRAMAEETLLVYERAGRD